MEENTIQCYNCGAHIDIHADKCPFCGYINEIGSEEKFIGKLEDIREDMDGLDEEAAKGFGREIASTVKTILKFIIPLIIVVLLVIGIRKYNFVKEFNNEQKVDDIKKTMEQDREMFPVLDEYYEAGDYDSILAVMNDPDTMNLDYHEWGHRDFMWVYDAYASLRDVYVPMLDQGNVDDNVASGLTYCTFKFYYETYNMNTVDGFSETELETIKEYREYALDILHNRMHMTDEEMEALREQMLSEGYMPFEECKKVSKKYRERFN